MTTILEFRLPLVAFPLGVAIEREPSRVIELERIVPSDEAVLPFFWVQGVAEASAFESDLHDRRAVRELELVSRTGQRRLYRARWNTEIEGFVRGISEIRGTVLRGRGTKDGWRVDLRFPDWASVGRFRDYCRENEVPIAVDRVYTAAADSGDGSADRGAEYGSEYELTDDQHETIRRAYEAGYFQQPQGITQTDLAAEFGVSQRAISRRLHRGLSRLVGTTIATDLVEPEDE
ncbi:helix-turn-helix domain-containing protein [Halobiforma nitratireducens]|uniref:DNA binding protein n=1 Tax=Halobiforma nitratireducens JCM 10879 TaxID=1227454 RepID=M0LI53_9EURY|nr:helix-turn-helix domain-containing protein [Halobiforma nitratireducens]EMA33307.1 DNA binding protein [Halobiforma nitratireducens JCM 10879]